MWRARADGQGEPGDGERQSCRALSGAHGAITRGAHPLRGRCRSPCLSSHLHKCPPKVWSMYDLRGTTLAPSPPVRSIGDRPLHFLITAKENELSLIHI